MVLDGVHQHRVLPNGDVSRDRGVGRIEGRGVGGVVSHIAIARAIKKETYTPRIMRNVDGGAIISSQIGCIVLYYRY